MTTKHTPGPWTVLPDTGAPNAPHFDALVMTPNGALGYWDKESERWHLKQEDARLIAAAADLLEALQLVCDLCAAAGMPLGVAGTKARAAIAKTTGDAT